MSKPKAKPAEIQPDPPDLPEVRLAHCGCVLSADAAPVGYRFKASAFGDVRVPVFACREHTKLASALVSPTLPIVKAPKAKPKRAAKSSPSKGTTPRPKSLDDQPKPEPT
jgi:hypothetical protein